MGAVLSSPIAMLLYTMGRTYTIEWFHLISKAGGNPKRYRIYLYVRQGKRIYCYLVQFRESIYIDILRSCIAEERNLELDHMIRSFFREKHLKALPIRISNHCTYRRKFKKRTCIMKHFLNDYFYPVDLKLYCTVTHPNRARLPNDMTGSRKASSGKITLSS